MNYNVHITYHLLMSKLPTFSLRVDYSTPPLPLGYLKFGRENAES